MENTEKEYCNQNYLSSIKMNRVESLRNKLLNHLRECDFIKFTGPGDIKDLNSDSNNVNLIIAVLAGGLYSNIIRIDRRNKRLINE